MVLNARNIVAVVAALVCPACAWLPDSGQYDWSRGTIDPAVRRTFAPGSTTRTDVLCLLGEPEWVSSDERRVVYQTMTVDSWFFVFMVGGLGVWVWGETVSELFEFDAHGVLLRHRSVRQPYNGGGDGGPRWMPAPSAEMRVLFEEGTEDR